MKAADLTKGTVIVVPGTERTERTKDGEARRVFSASTVRDVQPHHILRSFVVIRFMDGSSMMEKAGLDIEVLTGVDNSPASSVPGSRDNN